MTDHGASSEAAASDVDQKLRKHDEAPADRPDDRHDGRHHKHHKSEHERMAAEASAALSATVYQDRDGGGLNDEVDREDRQSRMPRKLYEREMLRLQAEFVTMQEWVRTKGERIVMIFEGRDAAGKGGTIKRITAYLNPRVARIAALPAPTERDRTQWYFQRYAPYLPAAGEMTLFDRSWYNRAGVERVMGFCTDTEYRRFLHQAPIFERMLVEDGIQLRKYWFSVSDAEQERRFRSRLEDPMRRWKLSTMDFESITRWEEYSRSKDEMFVHTDIPEAPWYVVEADDKRRARINMMHHALTSIPYYEVQRPPLVLPPRPASRGYERPPREHYTYVPDYASELEKASQRR